MSQPQYSIEARSLSLLGGAASHNFWVLRDDKGNAVAELHGLATDRETGRTIPIGTNANQHSLRGWQYIHDQQYARDFGSRQTNATYIQDGQSHQTVMTGDKTEILERWKAAAKYGVVAMNGRDLDYPPGGLAFPIQFDSTYNVRLGDNTVNSNSAYNTFGQLMGVTPYVFNGPLQPGINNETLSNATISNLRYRGREEYQFRQGTDPNGGDGTIVAAAGQSLQGNPFYQQAARAVQDAQNLPPIPQERLEQFIANVASASQQPPALAGQPQPTLDKIAAVAMSTNGQDMILSNQPFSESNTGKHVSVPLQQLIEQPFPVAQRQLQEAEQRQIAGASVNAPANTIALSETQTPSPRMV
jgi:hypothetical protein